MAIGIPPPFMSAAKGKQDKNIIPRFASRHSVTAHKDSHIWRALFAEADISVDRRAQDATVESGSSYQGSFSPSPSRP
jgi:hypothetical protein